MNEHTREMAELRAELTRTKRWVMVLAAGFAAVAFMAVAPDLKELRADRLVIGDEKHGIVLEAGPKTPPRLVMRGGDASIELLANGNTATLDLSARDLDKPGAVNAISLDAAQRTVSVVRGEKAPTGKLTRGAILTDQGLSLEELGSTRTKKASWP